MKVAVVGCGLIGSRRADAAVASGDDVVLCVDIESGRAQAVAERVDSRSATDWSEAVESGADAVVVATVNRELMPIAVAALAAGKHVLCEKPLGRNAEEAASIIEAAARSNRVLKTGFNHRHHPGIARAHEIASGGAIGELKGIRAAYGHGGRPGYDQEWRADPELAGGGELLDQGVHVVDLSRWFLGEIAEVSGMLGTWFWALGPLEDNAFALLRAESGAIASLHTSWTQWRNLFRFELFGRDGLIAVEGLGGSYGPERLRLARRRPEGGPPDEEEWTYPDEDVSWRLEWAEFRAAIDEGREPLGSGPDGYRAALVLDAIYASARERKVISL